MSDSFSKKLRVELVNKAPRKRCCEKAFERAFSVISGTPEAGALMRLFEKETHECCRAQIIRAMFILRGSVTDPEKRYHLEMSFPTPELRDEAAEIVSSVISEPKRGERRGRCILYYKDSAAIEDFLGCIGGLDAMYSLINIKMEREFAGHINRQVNCDTANIAKAVSAGAKQAEIIKRMYESGAFYKLEPELKITAALRLENPQMSLKELGALHNPPISKSGAMHRLEKIEKLEGETK